MVDFYTLLLSDLYLMFSCIISHPLYFCYFVFFFPYLLQVISFLSPLFFTTSLLCTAVVATHGLPPELVTQSRRASLILVACTLKLTNSKEEEEDRFSENEDLGVCEFLFGSNVMLSEENSSSVDDVAAEVSEIVKKCIEFQNPEKSPPLEDEACHFSAPILLKSHSDRVLDQQQYFHSKTKMVKKGESFSGSASMTREREWKRTLGCKLLEERHGGAAAMDSLWEVQEAERSIPAKNEPLKATAQVADEDGSGGVEVCCLQALKLSAGKMSLGVGRRRLAKMSKAIKGYRWLQRLHHVNKKVHDNGDG